MIEAQAALLTRPIPAVRPAPSAPTSPSRGADPGARSGDRFELSEEARRLVRELEARDREVRRHEEAHARVGGQYAGRPRYEYADGPDGKRYATSGEVPIDVSPVPGDPDATIEKMEIVKRAALAPARPSQQDRTVAAQADAQRIQAEAEKRAEAAAADPDDPGLSVSERLEAEAAQARDPARVRDAQAAYGARRTEDAGALLAVAA
jgi:hypothetical protein